MHTHAHARTHTHTHTQPNSVLSPDFLHLSFNKHKHTHVHTQGPIQQLPGWAGSWDIPSTEQPSHTVSHFSHISCFLRYHIWGWHRNLGYNSLEEVMTGTFANFSRLFRLWVSVCVCVFRLWVCVCVCERERESLRVCCLYHSVPLHSNLEENFIGNIERGAIANLPFLRTLYVPPSLAYSLERPYVLLQEYWGESVAICHYQCLD